MRLNKFLAHHIGISRREADEAIAAGKVQVNASVAQLGTQITQGDRIIFNGRSMTVAEAAHTTIVLHKPVGYVCSRRRQGDTPTIYELLPEEYQMLKPVGRLDKDSSGILLLTSDGDLAHQLTHPKFQKVKKYNVTLDAPLSPLHRQMINDIGVVLPDGPSRLTLERLRDNDDTVWLVTMHEGRNRQIRRTFAALGYQVLALHRFQFGAYILDDLETGKYTIL